jgi:hypothetical protein
VGIILRPRSNGLPAFTIAVSDGPEGGEDWLNKKNSQAALLALKLQDDTTLKSEGYLLSRLMHEAAEKAKICREKAKVPQLLWVSSISKQEVLIIEHSNSQLMDYPMVIVKLGVVSPGWSDGWDRYEEVKGRLETWRRDGNELGEEIETNLVNVSTWQ